MEEGLSEAGMRIELIPTLDRCVETAAKQELSRSTNEYLRKGEEDRDLEERIELLNMFLESLDFAELRSQSERHLLKGRTVRFIVCLRQGKPECQMVVDD
jgi:hypothetical protein